MHRINATCNRQQTEDQLFTSARYRCCTVPDNEDKIRTITVNFGRVPVDETLVKAIKLCSDSDEEESYEVHKDPTTNSLDTVFHFQKSSWIAAARSTIVCQVLYRPILPSQKSVDYFTIVSQDKPILKLIVRGESIGLNVVISPAKLFMICTPGKSVRKGVKMINHSDVPANFVFDVDETQNSCKPSPSQGRVKANSHLYILVTFEPNIEGLQSFYLPCLIQHQTTIIIQIYAYCGKEFTREEELEIPSRALSPLIDEKNYFRSYMSDCNRIRRSADANFSVYSTSSFSNNYLDFGRVDVVTFSGNSIRSPQTSSFTNHSQKNAFVKWREDVNKVFEVKPKNVRVRAGKTCLFEVRFDPKEKNFFYSRELTAQVFWSDGEEDFAPMFSSFPTNVSLRAIGHTFPVDFSGPTPQFRVPETIIMPACLPSRPVYATFFIRKLGKSPLMFRFVPPNETRFTVKPMLGVIYKNYQAIVVEMFPEGCEDGELFYERWAVRFNGNPDCEAFVDFRGYAENPCLNFSENVVNFSPTHPGCEEVELVSVRNTSRHCVTFEYENFPSSLINVDPVRGEICANETLVHVWTFRPDKEGEYEFDISCRYAASMSEIINSEDGTIVEKRVRIAGKCERGQLVAIPSELNFGETICRAESQRLDFQLTNPSSVKIPYNLSIKNCGLFYEGENSDKEMSNVMIEHKSGILYSGDSAKIEISVTAERRGFHELKIQYSILGTNFREADNGEICRVTYFGVLPTINIEDLLDHQFSPGISKHALWRLLNIKKLNAILNELQPGEKAEVEMNLPPNVLQDEALTIKLLIFNPTSSPASLTLKQIKPCSKNSKTMIKGNGAPRNFCTFDQKSTTLEPHEKAVVTMKLRYATSGKTFVKWDLNLGYERHVCLCVRMIGLTGDERKAGLLYGEEVELKKIYIGDRDPINQVCWIYNPTNFDISYELDTKVFDKVNRENCSEVFSCTNPSGIAKARACEPILIKFQPRRWGKFELEVPFTVGNEKKSITIKGESTSDPSSRISEESFPIRDAYHVPEVPVYFNTDLITLGPISTHSVATRMIMISNKLEQEIIAYKWKKYEIPEIIELKVEPETGRIQPGSLQTFRLVVATAGKPCTIDADVICEFVNQSEKRVYEKKILMHDSLCEQMKDYFTITEKGTSVPKPEELILEAPKPFYKAVTVRCYVYSCQDEELKTSRTERLKHAPAIEISMEKRCSAKSLKSASRETIAMTKFMLERVIWDVLKTTINEIDVRESLRQSSNPKYSQIAMTPLKRERFKERSYVTPSGRILAKLFENIIFTIVHKEFSLDMIHLTRKTDARQAAYQKM